METIDDIRNLNNVLSGTTIESYTDDRGIVIEYKSVPTRDKVIVRASKSGIITVHITKASETDNKNDDMLDIINWKDNNNSYDLSNTIREDVLKKCLKGLND